MPDRESEPPGPPEPKRVPDRPSRGSPAEGPRDRPSGGSSSRLGYLANLLTVVVALAAIGFSIWQGYENRRFYRLSVLPNLEPMEATLESAEPVQHEAFLLPSGADSVYLVGYALKNSGLGPAVLRKVLVYRDEEPIFPSQDDSAADGSDERGYLNAVDRDLNELPFPVGTYKAPLYTGAMLRGGEVYPLMTTVQRFSWVDEEKFDTWPPSFLQNEVLHRYSFVFCYCSVYETDCGMTHLGAEPPVENACGF